MRRGPPASWPSAIHHTSCTTPLRVQPHPHRHRLLNCHAFAMRYLPSPGTIDPKELKAAMQSLGFEAKNQTIYQMIGDIDKVRVSVRIERGVCADIHPGAYDRDSRYTPTSALTHVRATYYSDRSPTSPRLTSTPSPTFRMARARSISRSFLT